MKNIRRDTQKTRGEKMRDIQGRLDRIERMVSIKPNPIFNWILYDRARDTRFVTRPVDPKARRPVIVFDNTDQKQKKFGTIAEARTRFPGAMEYNLFDAETIPLMFRMWNGENRPE